MLGEGAAQWPHSFLLGVRSLLSPQPSPGWRPCRGPAQAFPAGSAETTGSAGS